MSTYTADTVLAALDHTPEFWLAVGKVSLYFLSMLICLGHALADIAWGTRYRKLPVEERVSGRHDSTLRERMSIALRNVALLLFGFLSAVTAWYHIWMFLEQDRTKFSSFEDWMSNSDWFVQAYRLVTATPQQWLFSSQLLHGFATWVTFSYVESIRSGGVRPLSSVWLGCAAAVSLSSPLFLAGVFNTPRDTHYRRFYVPRSSLLIICVIVSSIATVLLPIVQTEYYTNVLIIIHASLLIPPALIQWLPGSFEASVGQYKLTTDPLMVRRRLIFHGIGSLWVAALYAFLAGMSLMSHVMNFVTVLQFTDHIADVGPSLSAAFCCNPCQCSISADVVAVTVLTMVCILSLGVMSFFWALLLSLLTPVLSFATTLPIFLLIRELDSVLRRATLAEKILMERPAAKINPSESTKKEGPNSSSAPQSRTVEQKSTAPGTPSEPSEAQPKHGPGGDGDAPKGSKIKKS